MCRPPVVLVTTPERSPEPRRQADAQVQALAEDAVSAAVYKALKALGLKALFAVIAAVVAAALWVKGVEATAEHAKQQADTARTISVQNAATITGLTKTTNDLVLLQCAQPGLTELERRICAPYFPRMPR